jgi:hypothetical protein
MREGSLRSPGIIILFQPEDREDVALFMEVYADTDTLSDFAPFVRELIGGVGPSPEGVLPVCP